MSEIHNEPVTYEKIMAMFRETDKQIKELRESQKETNRHIGDLGNRFGELAEHLVAPGIEEKFNNIGIYFDDVSTRGRRYRDKNKKFVAEVDIVLENRELLIAVEVKSKLSKSHVDDHIARMEAIRHFMDNWQDPRKYRGAIAAAITSDETRNYAHKAGFYVIEQSGDTMKMDIPEGFVPQEWHYSKI